MNKIVIIHSQHEEVSRSFVSNNSGYDVISWYAPRTESEEILFQEYCKDGKNPLVSCFPSVVDTELKLIIHNPESVASAIVLFEEYLAKEPERKKNEVRIQRDNMISATNNAFMRHRRELDMQTSTTLTAQEYSDLCQYVQNLADVTEQENYPEVIWPELSETIRNKL